MPCWEVISCIHASLPEKFLPGFGVWAYFSPFSTIPALFFYLIWIKARCLSRYSQHLKVYVAELDPLSNCFNCVYFCRNLAYVFCKNLLSAFVSDGAPWPPLSSKLTRDPQNPLESGSSRSRDCENTSQTFQWWKQNLQRQNLGKIHCCSEKMRNPVWLMYMTGEKVQNIDWWDWEPRKPMMLER